MQAVPPAQDQLRVAAEEEKGLPDPPASVGAAERKERRLPREDLGMRESIGQKAVLPSPLAVLGLCCRRSRGAARCVS